MYIPHLSLKMFLLLIKDNNFKKRKLYVNIFNPIYFQFPSPYCSLLLITEHCPL